jgi:hypothetical protein
MNKLIIAHFMKHQSSIADPDPESGPGIWCFFDPWIRDPDPGWKKIQSQDPG